MEERILAGSKADEDVQYEAGLRPRTLDEYIGQERIRENLHVSIAAARQRGEALDHVLVTGNVSASNSKCGSALRSQAGNDANAATARKNFRKSFINLLQEPSALNGS